MAKAIGMKLRKAQGETDADRSIFFGDPAIPTWMEAEIAADEVFLAQIRLSDIALLDTEHILPHEGWLYFFLKAEDGSAWSPKQAVVRYSKDAPTVIIDGFNADSLSPKGLNSPYLVEFALVDADSDGMKLLGEPYDWNYEETPPRLLLQYDPLDSPAPFLSEMDGVAYFFFGEDKEGFADVVWHAEYS